MIRSLATAMCALIALAAGSGAHADYFYRNTKPVAPGPKDATRPSDVPGPLSLTLVPAGPIAATNRSPVNAVFHPSGGCPGARSFSMTGAIVAQLAAVGLTAGRSGDDYVISGTVNRASYGGTYNLTVTVWDACGASRDVSVPLELNPAPAGYDPPWDLHFDGTVAYAGTAFAFYPEIRNNASADPVDTTGFTYELATLDPVARPIPGWLRMDDPSTGVVTGTAPVATGSYGPYYITARAPGGGHSQSADFTVGVSGGFSFAGLDGTGAATVTLAGGQQRSLAFLGTGGCGVNRYFEVDYDTPLPSGMALVYGGDRWTIAGTPTAGGTWPVRLAFTDFACGPTQYFPVTLVVEGAPPYVLSFAGSVGVTAVRVNGPRDEQLIGGTVDTTGPAWTRTTCGILDAAGTPIAVAWATAIEVPGRRDVCGFRLGPDRADQAGTYTWRLRAVTDTGMSATSDPVTFTVEP